MIALFDRKTRFDEFMLTDHGVGFLWGKGWEVISYVYDVIIVLAPINGMFGA